LRLRTNLLPLSGCATKPPFDFLDDLWKALAQLASLVSHRGRHEDPKAGEQRDERRRDERSRDSAFQVEAGMQRFHRGGKSQAEENAQKRDDQDRPDCPEEPQQDEKAEEDADRA
jgi:hypothetical protein